MKVELRTAEPPDVVPLKQAARYLPYVLVSVMGSPEDNRVGGVVILLADVFVLLCDGGTACQGSIVRYGTDFHVRPLRSGEQAVITMRG